MSEYSATREIGIDAGHRIPQHHSVCRGLHGHRYRIYATVKGSLPDSGSTEGMAGGMDFSFLKEEMYKYIHSPCDHAFIIAVSDPFLNHFFPDHYDHLKKVASEFGFCELPAWPVFGTEERQKFYIMDQVPTAENLAAHWFRRLDPAIVERSKGIARLAKVVVYETPNCSAEYPA